VSLTKCQGEGILGAEYCCDICNQYFDLDYYYAGHYWHGDCGRCMLMVAVDLERVIYKAKQGPYNDWDLSLNELLGESYE
jgi:hypothetical protein